MGGNQALCDAADILPQIVALSTRAEERALEESDYQVAVKLYESVMIPRTFRWVQASGGASQDVSWIASMCCDIICLKLVANLVWLKLIEPSSLRGRVMIFFVARLLDVMYWISIVRVLLGYRPPDDTPELL
jgi:hypothetical protein